MTVRTGENPAEKARQQWRDRLMRLLIAHRTVPAVEASALADRWWAEGADTERLCSAVEAGLFLGVDLERAVADAGGITRPSPTGVQV
jgi:hypothetical protein